MGLSLRGDSANQAWGVMDVLCVTDFPDIRRKTAIQSAAEGSMLVIPREGGFLVRMYIELDKLADDQRVAALNVTTDHLIAAARRILFPYVLEVREIAWWSVYEIGQRICDQFDDSRRRGDEHQLENRQRQPRVFIAGDACHTHSPKAGQGMNVSMQDSFNLGWKLGAVLLGTAKPELLRSYADERKAIAQELIDFDHTWSRMFSARPRTSTATGDDEIEPAALQDYFVRQGRYTAGTATRYRQSLITGDDRSQQLAPGYPLGMRFHSAPVTRLADGRPMHLGHTIRADGRWRLLAFSNRASPDSPLSPVRKLCDFLANDQQSPVRRHTPSGANFDAVIELLAIFQQPHSRISVAQLPNMLLPRKGRYELIDYEKAYCAMAQPGQDIFAMRGVDRERGALLVVRPDQYVAQVLPLEAHNELAEFFARFLGEQLQTVRAWDSALIES
jgi:phenol 2-monooxygenase